MPARYDQCDCGKNKQVQSKMCRDCWEDRAKDQFICSCGEWKWRTSERCNSCMKENRSKTGIIGVSVRGPMPQKGQAAIYLLRDEDYKVFYVGSTHTPRSRIVDHRYKFGDWVTMIIIKIVDKEDRWQEEVAAMAYYSEYLSSKIYDNTKKRRDR